MTANTSDRRKQIGKRLAKGELQAWAVPFRQGGSVYYDRPLALTVDWEWYSPEGTYATGLIRVINQTPNELIIPPGTVWCDEEQREYELTEVKKIPPYNQSSLAVKAKQKGTINYEGKAQPQVWLLNGSIDEDEAVILINSPPQGTGFAWEEDEDEAYIFLIQATMTVKGGSKPHDFGQYKGRAKQKNTLHWNFAPGESLAGVRLFTGRLSGHMFHEAKLVPALIFWMQQSLTLKAGTLVMDFEGVSWQEVNDGSTA